MLAHFVRSACQRSVSRHRDVGTKALAVASAPHVFSTTATATTLQLRIPQYMVWGANTDVGKTLVSAGLAVAARRNKVCRVLAILYAATHNAESDLNFLFGLQAPISFLKPVQTGFPEDSDARLVVCSGSVCWLVQNRVQPHFHVLRHLLAVLHSWWVHMQHGWRKGRRALGSLAITA